MTLASPNTQFRPEVEGLRAIAVMSVVIYHVWPGALPGGYVGVDVFFVLSGFLITRLLRAEVAATGTVDIRQFYIRRLRRLMPAALLVLLVVAVLGHTLPPTRWDGLGKEIMASALYVENWYLAHLAVDYLAETAAASPVRHYWSLSIEEQFYIVWPILLVGVCLVCKRLGRAPSGMATGALWVLFGLSLLASIWLTETDPRAAYFVTHTRVWELALGALLASYQPVSREIGRAPALAIQGAGLLAILAPMLLYNHHTPFPGIWALIPTAGVAALLAVRPAGGLGLHAPLGATLPRYIGSTSYAQYLWHWPVIIFYQEWTGDRPGLLTGLVLIGLTLGISHLSKQHVEDRFRVRGGQRARLFPTLAGTAAGVAVTAVAAGTLLGALYQMRAASTFSADAHIGAAALTASTVQAAPVYPGFADAKFDDHEVYARGCHVQRAGTAPAPCRYGPVGSKRVLLMGDSHGASFAATFDRLAPREGFRLTVSTKSACPFIAPGVPGAEAVYDQCQAYNAELLALIQHDRPEVIIWSQFENHRLGELSEAALIERYRATMTILQEVSPTIIVIRDVIEWPEDPVDCAYRDRNCRVAAESARQPIEPLYKAALGAPGVRAADFTDLFCPDSVCPAIIGNVMVWQDIHHFSTTYGRSLAPFVWARIGQSILPDG